MAISAIVSGLGAIGITGTAATVGAVMLQGGLIGGTVNKIAGGSFSEGFLMGAITGGAEWAVSGALGAIAPSLGQLGNAIASSAIVAGATAAALGQKNWLQQGLLGGAAAGIFYQAVDWATSAFNKPSGAKPGSLVTDSKGNVFLIDQNGKGVHQPDMFAIADDATKTITISDTAGNVVNSTNQAAKPSQIYASTTAAGDVPPRVGLSTIGEIDGVPGTATYYTNGKATWTPINDGVGFGTSDLIDAGTIIRQDVTLDPNGLKTPSVDFTTASGYSSTKAMSNQPVMSKVNVNGVDGQLMYYTSGDDIVATFKPSNRQNYDDVTDLFANKSIVDANGNLYSNGKIQQKNLLNNYVDAAGQVYDAAGNPVAKLANAVTNDAVDWSGTLNRNYIQRANGDVIDSVTGRYQEGILKGELATPGTRSGKQVGYVENFRGVAGDVYKVGDDLVVRPQIIDGQYAAAGTPDIRVRADEFDLQGRRLVSKAEAANPPEIFTPRPQDTTSPPPPDLTPKPPRPVSQTRFSYDGADGILTRFDNGDYKFAYMNTAAGSVDIPGSQVRTNAAGQAIAIELPVASIDVDGVGLSAKGTRLDAQNFTGNYVDSAGMVYDDFGNPVAPIKNRVQGVNYEGTLDGGRIVRLNGDVVDVRTGQVTVKPVAPSPDVPTAPAPVAPDITIKPAPDATYTPPIDVAPPPTSGSGVKMNADEFSRLQNTKMFRDGQLDLRAVNDFIDQGYTPDQIIRAVENNPNGGWAGYGDGKLRSMTPGGEVAPPVRPVTPAPTPAPEVPAAPTKPPPGSRVDSVGNVYDPNGTLIGKVNVPQVDGYQVGARGQIYDASGTQIGQLKSAAANPDLDYSGTLTRDGTIVKTDGSAINTQGTVVRPPADMTPVRPQPPEVAPPPTPPVDTTPPVVDTTPTRPVTPDVVAPPVDTTPPVVDTTPTQPVMPEEPDVIEDIINNYRPTTPDITPVVPDVVPPPIVDTTPPVVDTTPPVVDTTPPVVDTTPTRPVTPDVVAPPVDTTPPVVDTTPTRPVTPDVVAPPVDNTSSYTGAPRPPSTDINTGSSYNQPINTTLPDVVAPTTPDKPGYNYVDKSGVMYDQYGNPSKDLSGNYVDKDGIVYDEFGNPAGDLTPGQNIKPGTDLSGTLNKDGTITKPNGSVIDYNGNTVKPPPGPETPVKPGIVSPIVTAPALNQPETPTGRGYTLNWGTPPTINLPGVNPGIYAQAVKPYYTNVTEIQPQYYWGKHPYAATEADLANYNNIPGAPAQPFGAQFSAVGGNRRMDVNQFIQNYMDPQYQAGYLGSQPQFAGSPGTRSPIQAAPAGPVPPSAIPRQPQMQQPAMQFAAPARMNVQTGIGSLPPVSIPTWTKEGGLYYAVPTAAAV